MFRSAAQVSHRTSLSWGVFDVFLMIRLGYGTKATEVRSPFHHILARVSASHKFMNDDDLDHPAGVMFAKFVHCNYAPFPFCTLWKRVSKHCPHSQRRVVLRTLHGSLSLLPTYSLTQPLIYTRVGSCLFILSFVLHSSGRFCHQLWPLAALVGSLYVPWTWPNPVVVNTPFPPGPVKCSRLVCPLPQP